MAIFRSAHLSKGVQLHFFVEFLLTKLHCVMPECQSPVDAVVFGRKYRAALRGGV